MKAMNPWITYRTRFLVRAKQLNTSLAFTDILGRQHSGRKGDYLVESSDGVLRIAPRQIFEDIYVPMSVCEGESVEQSSTPEHFETLGDEATLQSHKTPTLSFPPHLARKSPQSYRERGDPGRDIRSL